MADYSHVEDYLGHSWIYKMICEWDGYVLMCFEIQHVWLSYAKRYSHIWLSYTITFNKCFANIIL